MMTFEELKKARFVEHHKCSLCQVPIGYYVHAELAVAVFNSGCGCGENVNERAITHIELENLNA